MSEKHTELLNKYFNLKAGLKTAIYNEAKNASLFFGNLIPVDELNIAGHDIKYVVFNEDEKQNVVLSYGNGCIESYNLGIDDLFFVFEALDEKIEMIENGIKTYTNAKV